MICQVICFEFFTNFSAVVVVQQGMMLVVVQQGMMSRYPSSKDKVTKQ